MVYAALNANLVTMSLLAVFGGVWFDALSANPLGVSILPLFVVGFAIYLRRELILPSCLRANGSRHRCQRHRAGADLLLLLTGGKEPLLGWGSLWQWMVMTAGGAVATPVIFACSTGATAFGYQPRTETSFRPDREIRRGKL